jgi:multidrug resistance efflux pump
MLETPFTQSVQSSSEPRSLHAVDLHELDESLSQALWQRWLFAAGYAALGLGTITIGALAIHHRLNYLVIDNGLVNSRIVRLQAPLDGEIVSLDTQPGTTVNSGDILASLKPLSDPAVMPYGSQPTTNGQISASNNKSSSGVSLLSASDTNRLTIAQEQITFLQAQLNQIDTQIDNLRTLDTTVSGETLNQKSAQLQAAISREENARQAYDRFQQLANEGALASLDLDKARSSWETAKAEVEAMQANVRSAQATLVATEQGLVSEAQDSFKANLTSQRLRLLQDIQTQQSIISTLSANAQTISEPEKPESDAPLASKDQPSQIAKTGSSANTVTNPALASLFPITAPINGVIYKTERSQGEQINRSESFVTLLDCNQLWVETLIKADQADRIDRQQPVQVKLNGLQQSLTGEISLVQPISGIQDLQERRVTDVQALVPVVSPRLVGQPLTRVTVKITPPPELGNSQNFCGVGKVARVTFSKQ